jgi:ElaB/YqjD/DUF883 family membrane-anchored ribosome-binding protein
MKDLQPPKDPIDAMGEAYERLLETAINDTRKLENKSGPALHKLIDEAQQKLSEMGELSKEELERVAEYLKRDLLDAAAYIEETSEDIATWLGFDIELVEDRLQELLMQAADQTTVDLLELKAQAGARGYHTGEYTGPGTLICVNCGEKLHFHKVSCIPPCPKCKETRFRRNH